jgi:Nucleotidyl transferase of unknown function (DUF2204)
VQLQAIHGQLEATLRLAAATLRCCEVPFMLGGSMASWARGGPLSRKDIDLYVKPEDAERALEALVGAGMQAELPAEQWLLKARHEDVLVDLIFDPLEAAVTDERIASADWMPVLSVWMRVVPLEDVLVGRLLALSEQRLEFGGLVEIARALRERIDWSNVRSRTDGSACAAAFFALLEGLGVIEPLGRRSASGDAAPPGTCGAPLANRPEPQ